MHAILEQQNQRFIQDIEVLRRLLQEAQTPGELQPYQKRLLDICNIILACVKRNLLNLGLGQAVILEDVLSETQQVHRQLRVLNDRLAIPVLRAAPSDSLCLRMIEWVHTQHLKTLSCPPAFADGSVAIWPMILLCTVYFFPATKQRGLLYQPLLFHEFGHLLYELHKYEMNELVADLQKRIADLLQPPSQRNDQFARAQAIERQLIVDTWYRWTQELYCDAVGFKIGGPSFLEAFSTFLTALDRGDFYRTPEQLRGSHHPVTWLRVQFLAKRAEAAGFQELADDVYEQWGKVAHGIGLSEEYHGYYDQALEGPILRTIEDMIVETSPREFTEEEGNGGEWDPQADSPVRLLNWAWQIYRDDPIGYNAWETTQTKRLLSSG